MHANALDELKRAARRVKQAAREAARSGHTTTVNVSRRTNVRIVANVGESGSATTESAQYAPIVQDGSDRD